MREEHCLGNRLEMGEPERDGSLLCLVRYCAFSIEVCHLALNFLLHTPVATVDRAAASVTCAYWDRSVVAVVVDRGSLSSSVSTTLLISDRVFAQDDGCVCAAVAAVPTWIGTSPKPFG